MGKRLLILTFILTSMLLSCTVDINPGAGGFKITPTSHDFGTLTIGDIKKVEITLDNKSNDRVAVNLIQLSGTDISDFFITKGGDYPVEVDANDKLVVSVAFSPTSEGDKEVTLRIEYGLGKSIDIPLSGSGKLANGLVLLPAFYDFGGVEIGEVSTINVTFNNGTPNGVNINVAEITGSDSDNFSIISGDNVPIHVSGMSVFVFTIQFNPIAEGLKNVGVHIVLDDNVTSFNTNLNGTGVVKAAIEVTPPNYDYGDVGIGASVDMTFTIKNIGNSDVTLTNIGLPSNLYNNYEITGGDFPYNLRLEPGETHDFQITFTPLSTGKKTAKYSVSYMGDNSPFTGNLTGNGSDQPTLSPKEHDFGSVQIGENSTIFVFNFTNPTSLAVNVTNIEITGADRAAFTSNPSSSGSWPVDGEGGSMGIEVTFSPTKEGVHSATLNVTAGIVFQASLSGTGISVPSFEINPKSYDFGSVITGTMDSVEFEITNNGTGTLHLISLGFLNNSEGNFSFGGGAAPNSQVQPGAKHIVIVEFQPVTNGNKSATMQIIHDAPGSPALISIKGEGADVALTPGNVDFGSVEIGTTSSPQTFTVRNSTTSPITLKKIYLTGTNLARFHTVPSGNINQNVAANGGTYQFTATCSPTVKGIVQAVVNVDYEITALNKTLKANVKGEGIERPVISVEPISFDFGNVRLGTEVFKNFEVTNTGTGELELSQIKFEYNTGGDFTFASGDSTPVKITSGNHYIRVSFKPLSFGPKNCTLRIVHNGTGNPTSPLDIALNGNAIGPEFNLIPDVTSYAFGDCYVNKTVEKLFYISNGGNENLRITAMSVSNTTDFTIRRDFSLPAVIPAGGRIAIFTLVFNPKTVGNKNGTLSITHNSVNAGSTVTLTGTGLASPGELTHNFETNPNNSGWSYTLDWEWGIPINTTYPGSAHSGSRCMGTNIDGNYRANRNSYLVTPTIDLSKAASPVITFWMYVYCYTNDGGWLEYSIDGGNTWSRNLSPSPAYNGYINGGGAYNNNSGGWVEVTIDFSVAAGKSQVMVAWYFDSNAYQQTAGWYLDDIAIYDANITYPNTPVPYDNDINVLPKSNKFTMKWDCDGATSYDVYLSQSNPPTSKVANAITAKSYIATLTPDRKYFWKVVAHHPGSVTVTSQVWYFETVSSVPGVLINECETAASVDWVEFYNPTSKPVYIGGWELTIYADNNSNPDGVFTFPIGTILQPGGLAVVYDNQASSTVTYRTDFNIEWANATSPGEVIFTYPTDYGKPGVDYMKFNTLYNHKPADLSWTGSLTSNNTNRSSIYRNKATDTDNASDWSFRGTSPDEGVKNPGQ